MKIVSICYDDHANFMFDNTKALISVGINAISFKRRAHPFGYKEESQIGTNDEIIRAIKDSDIIQLFHSDSTWLDYAHKLNKRIIVYHTGTAYRLNSESCNQLFNDKVEICFTDQCEFIGLGMKNETYIATAVDTENIIPDLSNCKNWSLFAHYPSNAGVKGSDKILDMMNHVLNENINDVTFKFDFSQLSHTEQLARMNECYCYIEMFAPTQFGKPYGCYGVTAFEAAALGKLVITNNIHEEVYKNAYGFCPFVICNTEEEFISKTIDIMHMESDEIMHRMSITRGWIEKKHSYKATGEYLKKCLNL